jgi:hypothetical protein
MIWIPGPRDFGKSEIDENSGKLSLILNVMSINLDVCFTGDSASLERWLVILGIYSGRESYAK